MNNKNYTDEDLTTDIDWLVGYDIPDDEAEKFIRSILSKKYIPDKPTKKMDEPNKELKPKEFNYD